MCGWPDARVGGNLPTAALLLLKWFLSSLPVFRSSGPLGGTPDGMLIARYLQWACPTLLAGDAIPTLAFTAFHCFPPFPLPLLFSSFLPFRFLFFRPRCFCNYIEMRFSPLGQWLELDLQRPISHVSPQFAYLHTSATIPDFNCQPCRRTHTS